jgi:hypothetical protein
MSTSASVKNQERKDKITVLLLKNEIDNAIKILKPLYTQPIIENFDLNDKFLYSVDNSNLEADLNYFLNKNIDYSSDLDRLIEVLEKSHFIDIFFTKTVDLIKSLCQKISIDLKQSNCENIQ